VRQGVTVEQVAVVGLGAMGLPIAQRLAETLHVVVFDVAPDRVSAAAGAGARVAPTAADAGRDAGVVLIAVRTLAQAREALFGQAGAATALRAGTVVALTSTVGVAGARELAAELGEQHAELLDMPVSGGPARARRGDLLVMVGGSDQAAAAARPVIDALASTTARVGTRPGDGQAMKTVNQLLCGGHIAAAAEGLALGHPPEVLSRADIFVKDMGIVVDAGTGAGLALPVAAAAHQLYLLAQAAGLGGADDSEIATLLAARSAS
jgi:3-hydroxyisobutyrate dehydrogenase